MTQVIKCLPSKCKALKLNPVAPKEKVCYNLSNSTYLLLPSANIYPRSEVLGLGQVSKLTSRKISHLGQILINCSLQTKYRL